MEAMERLGFLQLAKRFLLLGKGEANNTPSAEDSRFIQPRPPAGRTLSLKIFNRVSASTEQLEQNEAVSDLRNDRLPRSEVTKRSFTPIRRGRRRGLARRTPTRG